MASVTETVQVLLMLIQLQYAKSEILVSPRDTEAVVGQQTYLNCSTSIHNKAVLWYHYPVGSHESNYIYLMGQLQPHYKNRFHLQRHNESGEFNLVIRPVETGDAGRYVCQEEREEGQHKVAELIVLVNPKCESNMKEDGVIGNNSCGVKPEELQLSCSITFHGNIPPIVEWRNVGDDDTISEGIHEEISDSHITSFLPILGDHIQDGASFSCQTRRSSTEQYRCVSDIVKIIYVFNIVTSTQAVVGEKTTCLANSSQPCVYKWKWSDDKREEIASSDATIMFAKAGSYICEAECKIREKTCSTVVRLVQVSSLAQKSGIASDAASYHWLFVLALAPVVLIAVVLVFAMFFVPKERNNQKNFTGSSGDSQQLISPLEIYGLAMLHDELYISRHHSANIEIYDSTKFAFKRQWSVQDLIFPMDLVCDGMHLFLFDFKDLGQGAEIFGLTASGKVVNKWSTGGNWGTISASYDSHIILTANSTSQLMEYSSDGQLLRQIVLTGADILNPCHSIKLTSDEYVVCYGRRDLPHHRVFVVKLSDEDNEGKINIGKSNVVKTFGAKRGSSFVGMDCPVRLDVGANGSIYVADHYNGRVLVLDSELKPVKELPSAKKHGLRRPRRLYLDKTNDRLLVSDNCRVLVCQLSQNHKKWFDINPAN